LALGLVLAALGVAAVGAVPLLAVLSLPPLLPQPAVAARVSARIVGPSTRMTVSLRRTCRDQNVS